MHFASPHYLWLLTLLAPMTAYYVWRTMQGGAAIRRSAGEDGVTVFTSLDTVRVLLDVLEETTLAVSTIHAE